VARALSRPRAPGLREVVMMCQFHLHFAYIVVEGDWFVKVAREGDGTRRVGLKRPYPTVSEPCHETTRLMSRHDKLTRQRALSPRSLVCGLS
jgi:hypothetical protein